MLSFNRIIISQNQSILRNLSLNYLLRKCHSSGSQETKVTFSNGRTLRISSGRLARMADGCAVVQSGDTNVMVVAVSKTKSNNSYSSFVPLTVDYRQKSSAAGRIPTNYMRREMGTTEKEILTSRLIDRSIRPQFPKGYSFETQLVCNLLSVDGNNDPDIVAINGASAALALSDIPWNGPIGAVRVAVMSDSEVITIPTRREMSQSIMNLVVSVNDSGNVLMLEAFANEPILEPYLLKAIKQGIKESKLVINEIKKLQNSVGKPKRETNQLMAPNQEHHEAIKALCYTRIRDVFTNYNHNKLSRDQELEAIRLDAIEKLKENFTEELPSILSDAYFNVLKNIYAELVIETDKRCDGRLLNELRPINCEINLFKPLHGSALFQRGQTQVMCTVSFDSLDSVWKSDPISIITGGVKEKNFMLHYEFPQYATNEIGRNMVGRREIGHGALAEKAIRPVVPNEFPFTIRLSCEVLESNGSSSMASVCAGSLALMDSGVNIVTPTAGVAMGLIKDGQDFRVLTDISGLEDYFGEMDFKIAGTKKAFTALQLDCKLNEGLPFKVLIEAIQKAGTAKSEIINIMNETIRESRKDTKENSPVSQKLEIPVHKRSKFLGYGGSHVKKLTADIGVRITQDNEDVNNFIIFAPNQSALNEALEVINKLLEDSNEPVLEFGAIYSAKIVEIRDNGVLVQLYPNMNPTLLHISQLDIRKVSHPSALELEVNQEIQVKYFGRDPTSGQIRLSRKVLQSTESLKKNLIMEKEL